MKKLTIFDFVSKSEEIHGNRYDYSLVEYINSGTKVQIICKDHGIFKQTPSKHWGGQGCPKCVGKQLSIDELIDEFKDIHGDIYDYSLMDTTKSHNKIKIICKKHGIFEQQVSVHKLGSGCSLCGFIITGNSHKLKPNIILDKFKDIHGDTYDYSLITDFNIINNKVKIICKDHGIFKQSIISHYNGAGCPKCVGKQLSIDELIDRFKTVHGDRYDYSLMDTTKSHNKIKIICKKHGIFEPLIYNHGNGTGCPKCNRYGYSKISIKWLDSFNLDIQHAENIGEYRIPKTIINNKSGIKVDGYNKKTNTVYEFLGDKWHGNLDVYKENAKPHPFSDKTALELNQEWKDRKKLLEDLGYDVVYIWENDFKNKCLLSQ